jgi:SPP1 family predicted phage head-tail adaptor
MPLAAGRLDKRVTIQTPTRASDDGGGYTTAWADTATVFAAVEPLGGQERFAAQQIKASMTHKVIIRHRPVNTRQRLLYGTRVFQIESVTDPNERGEMLELFCSEEPV